MPEKQVKIPRPAIFILEKYCRNALKTYLRNPVDYSGPKIGEYYSYLSQHAGIISRKQEREDEPKDTEDLISYTKDLLYCDEMKAGWHVLSRFMERDEKDNMLEKKIAQQHILDNYDSFLQKLYDHRIWFVGFIDERENCLTEFGKIKIINPIDYFPKGYDLRQS